MSYGFFDREKKEYCITDPQTPTPWINYLGKGDYGGIISQTAGGYSFDSDPRHKRVLRYRYNSIPRDQPGRYIYVRDNDSGQYWSATWQPVKKDYNSFLCRHGLGYTVIEQEVDSIKTETTYFVPEGESFEVWCLKIKNKSEQKRALSLFSYAEFSFFNAVQDQQNRDWAPQVQQGEFEDNVIFWNAFMKYWDYIFITSSLQADSFATRRNKFVGRYRDLSNPQQVEDGVCDNYEARRGNGAGVINNNIILAPGEEKEIIYLLGTTPEKEDIQKKKKDFLNSEQIKREFIKLQKSWEKYLSRCQVETPNEDVNLMLNTWNPYQCRTTFDWSRFVSLYQLGISRGMGFRDSAQDTLGVVHAIPEETKELIVKLLKCQHQEGNAYHLFYPLTGEGTYGEAGGDEGVNWYSDDHLWIILAVTSYIKETGNTGFLEEQVSFADDKGQATVFEHLCRALEFTESHRGENGLPLAGFADWNDTLNLDRGQGTAESVWTGMLYSKALTEMIQLLDFLGKKELKEEFAEYFQRQKEAINNNGWDGDWYLRAYDDDGVPLGTSDAEAGKIFLNPQSWSVMAGIADENRAEKALENVRKFLDTDNGVVLVDPPYNGYDPKKGGITTYPPGAKENGGVFMHSNPWIMIAEVLAGDQKQAFKYYSQLLPPRREEMIDTYELEPYVYCQNILGKEHPEEGLARNSWLTGTASWMYRAAVYYILGIRPDYEGIILKPAVPEDWDGYRVTRRIRDMVLEIEFIRISTTEEKRIVVNGKEAAEDDFIAYDELQQGENLIKVYYTKISVE